MKILLECSGYELLNVGDLAMLIAGYERIQKMWPHADIGIVTNSPQRLAEHCPGATAVPLSWPNGWPRKALSRRSHTASSWAHKVFAPSLVGRFNVPDAFSTSLRTADLIVATGGGFINDSFRLHALGVLNTLAAAQRLGRPTAMFGQGIGPVTSRPIMRIAARVLPKLDILGLREPTSSDFLHRLNVPARIRSVTGDDALALAGAGLPTADGGALGINIRVTHYTGLDSTLVGLLANELSRFAKRHVGPGGHILSLPISRHHNEDLKATEAVLPDLADVESHSVDISSPAELARLVADCRAVLTTSYHAGVFALARGIPVVGLSRSAYYDLKFKALATLFPPGSCATVRLDAKDWPDTLATELARAWYTPAALRVAISAAAVEMSNSSQALYERFADAASTS